MFLGVVVVMILVEVVEVFFVEDCLGFVFGVLE